MDVRHGARSSTEWVSTWELPARTCTAAPPPLLGGGAVLATGDLFAGEQEHVPAGAECVRALAVGVGLAHSAPGSAKR